MLGSLLESRNMSAMYTFAAEGCCLACAYRRTFLVTCWHWYKWYINILRVTACNLYYFNMSSTLYPMQHRMKCESMQLDSQVPPAPGFVQSSPTFCLFACSHLAEGGGLHVLRKFRRFFRFRSSGFLRLGEVMSAGPEHYTTVRWCVGKPKDSSRRSWRVATAEMEVSFFFRVSVVQNSGPQWWNPMKVTLIWNSETLRERGVLGGRNVWKRCFFPPSKMFVKCMSQTWGPKEMINETCW